VAILADVPCSAAGRVLDGYPHSIWQVVGHMNYWMEYELQRIAGQRPHYPEHAIESWPTDLAPQDQADWDSAREGLQNGIARLAELSKSAPEVLRAPVEAMHRKEEPISTSTESVLWQIMVHNSYHVGQIAVLMRAFGLWPPRAGTDTW
jgi:uncharacterized damage-inducible protein DinB